MEKDPRLRAKEPKPSLFSRIAGYIRTVRLEREQQRDELAQDANFILVMLGEGDQPLKDSEVRESSGIPGFRVQNALDRLYGDGDITMLIPGPDGLATLHANEYPLRVTGFLSSEFVLERLAEVGIQPDDLLDFEQGPQYLYFPTE